MRKKHNICFILGAGFSHNAGLPLQKDFPKMLLKNYSNSDIDNVITETIKQFLIDIFRLHNESYHPSLEDIFTCIDLSANTGHHLGESYPPNKLRAIRRMLIYRVFSIINSKYKPSDDIKKLLNHFCNDASCKISFIVMNWDIVLELHLNDINQSGKIDYQFPCYDWITVKNKIKSDGIPICKMHGSSNWVYCENCKSIFFDLKEKLALSIKTGIKKEDFKLFCDEDTYYHIANKLSNCESERKCKFCTNQVSSHIATFSYRKSFRTAAYSSIWYQAEKNLAQADRWIFIGYSLPDSDYEFKHMLKSAELQNINNEASNRISEVIYKKCDTTEKKFKDFFGGMVTKTHNGGLKQFVSHL